MASSRMIREGFLDSEKVAKLSWRAECFFHRLLLAADDYGLFDARATILRTRLFPMQLDKVSNQDIQNCLHEAEEAGLVRGYCVEGKDYVQVINFGQRMQSKPKFPLPENDGGSLKATVNHGNVRKTTVCHGVSRKTTAYTESDTKTDTKAYTKAYSAPTPDVDDVLMIVRSVNTPPPAQEQVQCAQSFIDEMEACGWLNKHGLPVTNWQAMARSFAGKWGLNAFKSSARDVGSKANRNTGTANEGRDYSL